MELKCDTDSPTLLFRVNHDGHMDHHHHVSFPGYPLTGHAAYLAPILIASCPVLSR